MKNERFNVILADYAESLSPCQKSKTTIMFRPDQPFVTIITALTRARLSLCALGFWRRLSLLGGDEGPAVMRFSGFSQLRRTSLSGVRWSVHMDNQRRYSHDRV